MGHLKKGHKQRLHGWFQPWADIEAEATILRWYEPMLVPGLLQTEDYARAILSVRPRREPGRPRRAGRRPPGPTGRVDRPGAPQLWCVLGEAVLHRPIGGPKVMRSQLYRLAEAAGLRP